MMKYALGNILYFWPKAEVENFYQLAKDSDADVIYLGESVCSKRRELRYKDYIHLANELSACGKQVVLSTMVLLEAPSELNELKRYCNNGDYLVEANDMGAVNLLRQLSVPFVGGCALNIYNHHALALLHKQGMVRWCMPVELSRDRLKSIVNHIEDLGLRDQIEIEVFSYGHLPLAYSARCFTARSENRAKDECQLCCINYPQGRLTNSQEGQTLFKLNGIQTMSGECYDLRFEQQNMNGLVDIMRVSAEGEHSLDVLRQLKRGELPIRNQGLNNGYWHQIAGIYQG